ncbi:hypothetical protein KVT40_004536 [Elsinoe batatas]|uniref:Uncharacterized protein n=1 Tax=Elsinoe batatas TaxID=2601811 RepID=A0A8K0L7B4_9PEZI|nr:hypothetical protein KVT40_004536 [Elsinoe batatas]
MAHGSCPKCGASVGGSSKTCGSCGAEKREENLEMRDDMTRDEEAIMKRGHRPLA